MLRNSSTLCTSVSKPDRVRLLLASFAFFIFIFAGINAHAQTTEFTYQGSLKSGGVAANGNFDFEFLLFDSLSGGAQFGLTQPRNSVLVSAGIFSVKLDFGAQFPGASRFLEIHVRQTGGGGFTPLTPRQPVSSSPYSVKSLNADTSANTAQLGGVAASQYVITTDTRMSDSRSPTAGNASYIQNQNAGAQAASNFSISGSGTVAGTLSGNIVDAAAQYNIGGSRVLSTSSSNLLAGVGTSAVNTGFRNSFFGTSAGESNTSSSNNSFIGANAGRANTEGDNNTFVGSFAGDENITGDSNSFFGSSAGTNTIGGSNSFVGSFAGAANTTGSNNTIVGKSADVGSGALSFATALGAGAEVSSSNTVVLGRSVDIVRVPGTFASVGQITTNGNLVVLGTSNLIGAVDVATLGAAGSTDVCRNASNQLSTCSSSLRYKTGVNPFFGGLDVVRRLRPITFNWKDGGMHDVGFGAEDVEQVEPLLTTRNDKGEIEGVKYGQITTVLVNAVKEQQVQIEAQQKQIEQQRKQIESLTKIICAMNPKADICQQ